MKKIAAIIALSLVCITAKAQLLSHYFDASDTQLKGFGYSYNITVQLRKSGVLSDGSEQYDMTLLTVVSDSKGFLYNNKYYSQSSLGGACATPQNFGKVQVYVTYDFVLPTGAVSQYAGNASFEYFDNFGQVKTRNLGRKVSNIKIRSIRVTRNDDACVAKIKELLNPQNAASNPTASSINQKSTELTVSSSAGQRSSSKAGTDNPNSEGQSQNRPASTNSGNNAVDAWNKQVAQDKQNLNRNLNNFTNTLSQYVENQREERQAKRDAFEREQNARMQKQAEETNRMIDQLNEQKRLTNKRKAIVANYPEKGLPTTGRVKNLRIYYFAYAYDNLANDEPVVFVSNVFEIGKSADGARVSFANVKEEIASLTPHEEVLYGFYGTKEKADKDVADFVEQLQDNGVTIKPFYYIGKPAVPSAINDAIEKEEKERVKKITLLAGEAADDLAKSIMQPYTLVSIDSGVITVKGRTSNNLYVQTTSIDLKYITFVNTEPKNPSCLLITGNNLVRNTFTRIADDKVTASRVYQLWLLGQGQTDIDIFVTGLFDKVKGNLEQISKINLQRLEANPFPVSGGEIIGDLNSKNFAAFEIIERIRRLLESKGFTAARAANVKAFMSFSKDLEVEVVTENNRPTCVEFTSTNVDTINQVKTILNDSRFNATADKISYCIQ